MSKIRIISIAIGLFFLTACNILKNTSRKNIYTEDNLISFKHYFIEASKEQMLGNDDEAIKLYQKCLDFNPQSAVSMYELGKLYAEKKDIQAAISYTDNAIEINSNNFWYYVQLANIYQLAGNYEKSIEVYENAQKKWSENYEIYIELASLYTHSGKIEKAIDMYDLTEKKFGVREEILIAKIELYHYLKQYDKAELEIKRLLKLSPDNQLYIDRQAELYAEQGKLQQAIDILETFINENGNGQDLKLSLAKYYIYDKQYERAYGMIVEVFQNPNVSLHVKLPVLLSKKYFYGDTQNNKEKFFVLLNILEEVHSNEPEVHAVYADYLILEEDWENAQKQLIEVIEIDKSNYMIWEKLFKVCIELHDEETLLKYTNQALEYYPNQPEIYLYKSAVFKIKKQYEEALKLLEMGQMLIVENPQVQAQFYLQIAENAYSAKKYEKAFTNFDSYLQLVPNDIYVKNNYAYYLSLQNTKLDYAKTLIDDVLKEMPNWASFLDTKAWILYQKKEYKEALIVIKKAIQNNGDESPDILEHYGDILYKNGEIDNAVEAWQKSVKQGNKSDELKNKIKNKKLE